MIDPLTGEEYVCPVVASDGHTYTTDWLRAAVAADPWHRSPITKEVLRAAIYPNRFVSDDVDDAPAPLFAETNAGNIRCVPDTGTVVDVCSPKSVSADMAAVRISWRLPPVAMTLTVRMLGDHLMHPPVAECPDCDADPTELASLFGIQAKNLNCLSTAVLTADGQTRTVEGWLVRAALAGASS